MTNQHSRAIERALVASLIFFLLHSAFRWASSQTPFFFLHPFLPFSREASLILIQKLEYGLLFVLPGILLYRWATSGIFVRPPNPEISPAPSLLTRKESSPSILEKGAAIFIALFLMLAAVLIQIGIQNKDPSGPTGSANGCPFIHQEASGWLFFLTAVFAAPILEELLYRWSLLPFVLGAIRDHRKNPATIPGAKGAMESFPTLLSIAVSSLLFALVHPPASFLVLWIAGILLAILMIRYGLTVAILTHMLYNGSLFALECMG